MFLYGVTVSVERSAGADRHGNPLEPVEHLIRGCAVAPPGSGQGQSSEASPVVAGTVEWDLDLLAPYGADVVASDVVVVGGERFQVFGRPASWRNPFTGREAGTVARLKGVSG